MYGSGLRQVGACIQQPNLRSIRYRCDPPTVYQIVSLLYLVTLRQQAHLRRRESLRVQVPTHLLVETRWVQADIRYTVRLCSEGRSHGRDILSFVW